MGGFAPSSTYSIVDVDDTSYKYELETTGVLDPLLGTWGRAYSPPLSPVPLLTVRVIPPSTLSTPSGTIMPAKSVPPPIRYFGQAELVTLSPLAAQQSQTESLPASFYMILKSLELDSMCDIVHEDAEPPLVPALEKDNVAISQSTNGESDDEDSDSASDSDTDLVKEQGEACEQDGTLVTKSKSTPLLLPPPPPPPAPVLRAYYRDDRNRNHLQIRLSGNIAAEAESLLKVCNGRYMRARACAEELVRRKLYPNRIGELAALITTTLRNEDEAGHVPRTETTGKPVKKRRNIPVSVSAPYRMRSRTSSNNGSGSDSEWKPPSTLTPVTMSSYRKRGRFSAVPYRIAPLIDARVARYTVFGGRGYSGTSIPLTSTILKSKGTYSALFAKLAAIVDSPPACDWFVKNTLRRSWTLEKCSAERWILMPCDSAGSMVDVSGDGNESCCTCDDGDEQ